MKYLDIVSEAHYEWVKKNWRFGEEEGSVLFPYNHVGRYKQEVTSAILEDIENLSESEKQLPKGITITKVHPVASKEWLKESVNWPTWG